MQDDFYQMYLDDLAGIPVCNQEEIEKLLPLVAKGEEGAKARLTEGMLSFVAELAKEKEGLGLPMGDLVQEANLGLMKAIQTWSGGDFKNHLVLAVDASLKTALEAQKEAGQVGEEMLARVNVLKNISQAMAEELGREASVEELAAKMKMTVEEIKGIMKLTLDAMSVSPSGEE